MDAGLILVSVVALGVYSVLVKTFPHKLVLLFLVNLFTYLGFLGVYFVHTVALQRDPHAFRELIYSYVYEDMPLYLLIAVVFLGSMIVSERLFDRYDLSLVVPLSQLGVLLASASYLVLGDPFEWTLPFGFIALSAGATIVSRAAGPSSSPNVPGAAARGPSRQLWLLVLAQAVLFAASSAIYYLGTKETSRTSAILAGLNRLHIGPMAFHGAFYFNLGQQFFSLLGFLAFLLASKKHRHELIPSVTAHVGPLSAVVLAYFITQSTYLAAFAQTTNTTILLALDALATPFVLLLSFLILGEGMSRDRIVGSVLIVAGGILAGL